MLAALLLVGCSTTSNLPEDEILYTGLKKITYTDMQPGVHFENVKDELEAALACAPNGSLLGSSSMREPLQLRLRVYNKYANSESKFGKWMLNSFGTPPVLISQVNPETRAIVAENVLQSNGYFYGKVASSVVKQKNPKKQKISYNVTAGRLYTIDTVSYYGYPAEADSLIAAGRRLEPGMPFTVAGLDAERNRISSQLRNNGYYYYRPDYTTFVADTVSVPGKVKLRVQQVDSLPPTVTRKWWLGRMAVDLRRTTSEQPSDTVNFRKLTIMYSGKKPPIRPRAVLRDLKVRPDRQYSLSAFQESSAVLNSLGLFAVSDYSLTPRDTSALCDTLDMKLTCVLDKPYDGSVEANYALKSNNRTGPGLVLGLTKRNAFRGGEKLSLSLSGSYEWQTDKRVAGSNSTINSYTYGADVSVEYPRLETPFGLFQRHRFYAPPHTKFSLAGNVQNRASFFKMLTVTGEVTYKFQTSPNSRHEFSPLLLDYNYMSRSTAAFDSVLAENPALYISMRNQFVPKIKYSYTYTSPSTYSNPIMWETTLTESGNLLSLAYMAGGKKFGAKDKDLFGNPFAQFIKISSSIRKTWRLGQKSQLVGRIAGGFIYAYGNSERAPYSEQFYVGGANSIRAFTVRSIGPGTYVAPNSKYAYLDQTGDVKLETNLEYRFNIFGSLYGATFFDMGNIWLLKADPSRPDAELKSSTFFRKWASGTGAGIRYDMDFIVLRLDVGIALHVPYDTGKSGYYNIPKFGDGISWHFAIGYPF